MSLGARAGRVAGVAVLAGILAVVVVVLMRPPEGDPTDTAVAGPVEGELGERGVERFGASTERSSAVAQPQGPEDLHASPWDAARALGVMAGMDDPRVEQTLLIHGDQESVSLRVRVADGNTCLWFGVGARVTDGVLVWSTGGSGPGLPC